MVENIYLLKRLVYVQANAYCNLSPLTTATDTNRIFIYVNEKRIKLE